MLAGSKDRTRTPRLHPFDAGGSRFCPLALEPRASLHRFPCSRQCKSILVRFPEQSATHKQPNICHSALPLRGAPPRPNDVRCVKRWATSRVGGRGARIRVGSSVTPEVARPSLRFSKLDADCCGVRVVCRIRESDQLRKGAILICCRSSILHRPTDKYLLCGPHSVQAVCRSLKA